MHLYANVDNNLLITGAKLIHRDVLADLRNVVFEVENIEFIRYLLNIALSNIFKLVQQPLYSLHAAYQILG